MSEDMVERVARAIAKSRGVEPDECHYGNGWVGPSGSGSECTMYVWERCTGDARAAIEALREPTEAMVLAAEALGDDYHNAGPRRTWPAMIDTALSPTKE